MSDSRPPRLLHFRVSHYNEKARWALDFKRWPHVREALVAGFHIPRTRRLTGQTKVPILVLGDRVIHDSNAIIAELERLRPDPPLFSLDPAERARASAVGTYFDDEVAPDLRRIIWSIYLRRAGVAARLATDGFGAGTRVAWLSMWPIMRMAFVRSMGVTAARVERARARLDGVFDRLEREIGASGYIAGDRFTVADLTAAAVVGAFLRPPEYSYPFPDPIPDALLELRARYEGRDGARWVRDMFARHRGPSFELAS